MSSRASSTESSQSIHRLLSGVKRLSSRPPFNKSQPSSSVSSSLSSSSSSSLSSSIGISGYGGSHNGRSGSDKTFDLLLRSFSSEVLILVTSLGFLYWSSSSLNPNPYVSYADNYPKEAAAWAIGQDPKGTQFSLLMFHTGEENSSRMKGGSEIKVLRISYSSSLHRLKTPTERAVVPVFPPSR